MKGRQRCEKHLKFIRTCACIKCGNNIQTEAAHYRRADARIAKPITGNSIKPHDWFVLPLCSGCHRHQHEIGEYAFWHLGEPVLWALALYAVSGDINAAEEIIQAALRFQR